MFYKVNIKAKTKSNLSQNELKKQLVVALHNTDSQYSKFDGVDDNLEVVDYGYTNAEKL